MGIVIACLCRKSESGQKRWLSWLSRVKSWFASHVERLECPKRWDGLRLAIFGSARVAQPSQAELQQHYQPTKSTKFKLSTKTTASSIMMKAKSGLATLKHKATAIISSKKKRICIPEDAETQVCQHPPQCITIVTHRVQRSQQKPFQKKYIQSQVWLKLTTTTTPRYVNITPMYPHIDMEFKSTHCWWRCWQARKCSWRFGKWTQKVNYLILSEKKDLPKLVWMMKWCTSPVYALYQAMPDIQYIEGCCMHVFACVAKLCTYKCHCFLDGPDC